jgi:hypothetical protein
MGCTICFEFSTGGGYSCLSIIRLESISMMMKRISLPSLSQCQQSIRPGSINPLRHHSRTSIDTRPSTNGFATALRQLLADLPKFALEVAHLQSYSITLMEILMGNYAEKMAQSRAKSGLYRDVDERIDLIRCTVLDNSRYAPKVNNGERNRIDQQTSDPRPVTPLVVRVAI